MRMARAGYAFTLVQEPLLVYRYYSGNRREIGRGIKKDLMGHLVDKFKEVDVMGCRGCRGRRQSRQPTRRAAPRPNTEGVVMDEDVVLVKYTHPNRGQHRVIGPRSKRIYGHRGGGEQFYVLRIDMEAMPQWFKEIRETPRSVVVAPERVVKAAPPPPKPIVEAKPVETAPEQTYEEFLAQAKGPVEEEIVEEVATEVPPTRPPVTIDTLPGISPQVATALKANGIETPTQLIALGEEDFQSYKGIGPARAEAIISAAEAYIAELEAAP
jgi:predicted flap endonuclease-1-like 5' DNA nuclease